MASSVAGLYVVTPLTTNQRLRYARSLLVVSGGPPFVGTQMETKRVAWTQREYKTATPSGVAVFYRRRVAPWVSGRAQGAGQPAGTANDCTTLTARPPLLSVPDAPTPMPNFAKPRHTSQVRADRPRAASDCSMPSRICSGFGVAGVKFMPSTKSVSSALEAAASSPPNAIR